MTAATTAATTTATQEPREPQLPPGYKPWHWWTPWRKRYRPAVVVAAEPEPVLVADDDVGLAVFDEQPPVRPAARRPAPPVVRRRTELITQSEEQQLTRENAEACPECGGLNPFGRTYCQFCAELLDPQAIHTAPVNHILFAGGVAGNPNPVVELRPEGNTIGEKIGNAIGAFADWLKELPDRIKKLIKKIQAKGKTAVITTIAVVASVITLLTLVGPTAAPIRGFISSTSGKVRELVDPTAGNSVRVQSITASSTMNGTSAVALIDGDTRTFWASAPHRSTDGVGTSIHLTLSGTQVFDRIRISPGIQNGKLDPNALATPHQLTIQAPGQPAAVVELIEVNRSGGDDQIVKFAPITASEVTVTVDSVYPSPTNGSPSVAISILGFIQVA